MKRVWPLIAGLVIVSGVTYGQQNDATAIVKKIDELYRSQSSYTEMEMEIVTPHWQRTLRMKVWTKGTRHTFIRITAPAKEAGVATLRVGNEMWNYLPNTNKVMKIPPSMMMSSWMGSDFTNNDLVQEFTLLDDYNFDLVHPDTARQGYLYIRAIPKQDRPIVWGKQLITVRKSDSLPVREEYYDEKGNLMRVLNFRDITQLGGRTIPAVMEMLPKDKEGNRTVIRYLDARFDTNVSDDIFSLRNLRTN